MGGPLQAKRLKKIIQFIFQPIRQSPKFRHLKSFKTDLVQAVSCQLTKQWTLSIYIYIYTYTLIFLDHIWYRLGYVRNSRLYGGFTRTYYGHLGSIYKIILCNIYIRVSLELGRFGILKKSLRTKQFLLVPLLTLNCHPRSNVETPLYRTQVPPFCNGNLKGYELSKTLASFISCAFCSAVLTSPDAWDMQKIGARCIGFIALAFRASKCRIFMNIPFKGI